MLKGSTVLARRHGQVDDVTKGSQCIVIDRGIGAIQYVVSVSVRICWTNNKRRVAQPRLLLAGDVRFGHGSNDPSKHAKMDKYQLSIIATRLMPLTNIIFIHLHLAIDKAVNSIRHRCEVVLLTTPVGHKTRKKKTTIFDLHCNSTRGCGSAAGDPWVPSGHGSKALNDVDSHCHHRRVYLYCIPQEVDG